MSIGMDQNGVSPSLFRWDVGLTRLCQRLPDLAQQSDFQPLLAQQVRIGRAPFSVHVQLPVRYDRFSSTTAQTHSVPLQAAVDPSVSAEVLARYLLQPPATLAVADCFRPVLLEILNCLLDKQNEYTATNAVRYYIALEQILEVAPHLERYILLACSLVQSKLLAAEWHV